jgi:hypothetical protein
MACGSCIQIEVAQPLLDWLFPVWVSVKRLIFSDFSAERFC